MNDGMNPREGIMDLFKCDIAPDERCRTNQAAFPAANAFYVPGKIIRHAVTALVAITALLAGPASAQSVTAGANLWAANSLGNPTGRGCGGCHATPPGLPTRNAANAVAVIDYAITNDLGGIMGSFSGLTAVERSSIALYIGSTIASSQTATVAYGGSVTINLNDIATASSAAPSMVINAVTTVGSPTGGTLGAYSLVAPSVVYTHTALSCTNGGFTFQGTGGSQTSNRTVTVTVTPPAPPTAAGSISNISYNSASATNIPLSLGGAAPTSINVTQQPSVGVVTVTGSNTVGYTASASAYQASVTFQYRANGPCANSAVATVTVNVAPPPAPTVTAPPGPFQTAFNTAAAPINLTANISGISTSIAIVSNTNGVATPSGNAVTFVPANGFTGVGSFTYRAIGPGGPSATSGPVNITVLPAIPVVSALPGPFSTPFNTPINIDLTGRVTGTFTSIATTAVTNGTTSVAGNVVTFTPTSGFSGIGSFQFTATNAGGISLPSASMNITVLPPPPVVAARSVSVTFQLPLLIDLTAQITGVSTSIAVTTPPLNGITSVSGNVVTYTPNALFTGADSFSYQATGPGGISGIALVSISVVAPAPPTATSPPPVTTSFNTQVAINMTAQLGGVFINLAVVTPPTNGTIVSVVGNIITYRPNTGYVGADNFTYRALGPGGTQSTPPANVGITVLPAGPIVIAPPPVTTAFNTAVAINLTAQISGSATSIAIATPPTNGTTSIAGNTVTYTPTAGYSGSDSFTYTATGVGGTSPPSPPVSITILPTGPTVAGRSVVVGFSTPTAIDLTAQITGTVTSIAVVTLPARGSIVSVVGKVITYAPNNGFAGADSFTYRAMGPGGTSGVATVSITVSAAPAPTLANVAATTAFNAPVAIDVTAQLSGLSNSIAVATPPANGTIISVVGNVITYTPKAGFIGNDSFAITATGAGGTSSPATVTVIVTAPAAPTAANSVGSVTFNTPFAFNLSAQISGVVTSIAVVAAPANGSTSVVGNVITYTPNRGFFGIDSFAYTATGPGGTSAPATVTLTVTTSAPVAGAFKMIVPLNTSTTMDLAPFITGSAITGIVVAGAPKHGTATVNGTKVTFTPTHDYFGSDTFTYAAFGNAGTSPAAIVTVTIVGRPDPSKDASVAGLVTAQTDAARRFAKAQISNFQSRMESLHRADVGASTPSPARADDGRTRAAANENAYLNSSFAAATAAPEAALAGQKPLPFLNDAVSILTSGSINFASLAGASSVSSPNSTANLPSLWLAGTANFGTRSATGIRTGLDFNTSGISMGMDRRFGDQLVLGAGLGFARDRTDIGADGSRSRARAVSLVAYGSYQPSARTFVDGLIGIGSLDFTTQRYVTAIADIASGDRKGRQVFGSVSSGLEYRDNGVLISPYARLDYSSDRLNQVSETGAGQYALTYFKQTTPSIQGALGVRAESVHTTGFGLAAPRLRAEYRHDFQGERQTAIGYADSVGGRFGISTGAISRNTLVLGIGSEFIYRGGWTLGIDYQLEHSTSFSRDSSQGIKFTITKDLDGRDSPYSLINAAVTPQTPIDIQVDVGFMFDNNVTRGKVAQDKLSDRVYSVNASKNKIFSFNPNLRAILTGSISGEKFDNYYKLSGVTAGIQGEVEYRPSAEFGAPTFAVFAQTSAEHHESRLRNGYRYSLGASVRQPLTDRIGLFGAISHNERYGKSSVFNNRFNAVRFNIDYALNSTETFYLSGEYRRGQIVSTGLASIDNLDVADVFVQDDAYPGGQFFSYQFDGRTVLSTLGYNLGLGPRHSLDLSWRRAQSKPNRKPDFATSGSSYIADQYSIVYLVRF